MKGLVLAGALLLASGQAFADQLLLPARSLDRTGPVTVEYRLSAPTTGTATVTLDWTDSYGREVAHRMVRRPLKHKSDIPISIDLRRAVAMQNKLRARCLVASTDKAGRPERSAGTASTTFIARPPDRGWRDYQVIMWQTQPPARLAGLARLGVTAGLVLGTRGPLDIARARREIAPFLALNLRWYIENIATDFYAAYHRWHPHRPVNWLFEQVKRLYRRNPSNLAAFIRTPSLSDPRWLRRIARRLRQHVRVYGRYRPLFYNLADEAGIADLAAAWDFDFSPSSLAGMRLWLKRQYGTLAALNREWGTNFASWGEVMPMTTDEALRRTDGNFAAWEDFKAWMDTAFARAVRTGSDALHAADPRARSGLEGAQMPGWGGYDYGLLAPAVDVMEIYDHGSDIAIARGLNPRLIILNTSPLADPRDLRAVWHHLLEGARGLILWDPDNAFVDDAGAPTQRGRVLAGLVGTLRSGLAAQLIASARQKSAVAILYSQASYRLEWLLDRRRGGGAWADRTSATEWADDNAVRAATQRAVALLRHLGIEPRWLTRAAIDAGALRRDGIRLLVLPHTIALSPREAARIRAFAARGGMVAADAQPGLFDNHGRRLPHPLLAPLSRPSLSRYLGRLVIMPELQRDAAPGDPAPLAAMARRLKKAEVPLPFTLRLADGAAAGNVEAFRWRNGGVSLLAFQRDPRAAGPEAEEDVTVRLPRAYYAYDISRPGAPIRADRLVLHLDRVAPEIVALAPVPLPALKLRGPGKGRAGERLAFRITAGAGPSAACRVVRIRVIAPTGDIRTYSQTAIMRGRTIAWRLPLALNDPAGRWIIRVTDVLSGQSIVHPLSIAKARVMR